MAQQILRYGEVFILKRTVIFFFLISLLFITGCATTTQNQDSGKITDNSDPVGQKEVDKRSRENLCIEQIDTESFAERSFPYERIVVDSNTIAYYMALYDAPVVGIPKTSKPLPEKYEGLPEIGIPVDPNIEVIVSLNPDLFVGDKVLEHFTKEPLEKHGINTIYLDNSSYDAVYESIIELGKIFEREEIGEAFVDCQKEKEAAALADIEELKDKKVALILGTAEYFKLGTKNSYLGSILEKIGVENIANKIGETDQDYITFSKESLLAENPDYILAISHGGNPAEVKKAFEQEFAQPVWDQVKAKANGQIYYLDSSQFPVTGTIRNVETLEALVDLLAKGATSDDVAN